MDSFGLYIHIPFCRSRCIYCGFKTYVGIGNCLQSYIEVLELEISRVARAREWSPVTSVYFGGGNPALVGPVALSKLLDATRRNFNFTPEAEISFELNPEDAKLKFLKSAREAGFNRLSIGWQTLSDKGLAFLSRRHNRRQALDALSAARRAGFDNINVDMIFGLPGQTMKGWTDDLATLAESAPDHVSTYALSVDPGTRLKTLVAAGEVVLPDEDVVADLYDNACRSLDESGFKQYEISNFAKAGRACQHNLNYWRGGEYIGFGAGAHSHIDGKRTWCFQDPQTFIEKARLADTIAGSEDLDNLRKLGERLMLGLRLREGIDVSAVEEEFQVSLVDTYGEALKDLKEKGLIDFGERLALTRKGLFLANEAMVEFV